MTANDPAFPGLDSLAYPSPVYNPGISVRLHVATVLAAAAYGASISGLRTFPPALTDAQRRVIAQQAVYMADALLAAEGSAA